MKLKSLINMAIAMVLAASIAGCRQGDSRATDDGNMKYASWLDISDHDGYTVATVKNPWIPGAVLQTYVLVPRGTEVPQGMAGTVVQVPLQSALVYSSVHGGVIKELGGLSSITGVCDLRYFDMDEIRQGVADGRIVDAGSSMQPTIEKVVQLHPDAIILSPFQNSGYGTLANMGIPIIECADYMENTPLGRAEWIKLFGALYGRQAEADSIFTDVVKRYDQLKAAAESVEHRPKVISETVTGGVWYMPGGDSYMGHLYADAGADYPWSGTGETGSLSLSFEQVYAKAHDADIWLIKSLKAMTYHEFAALYPINSEFKAFKVKSVYQCPTLETTLYRDFPFHPDVLLGEYIRIFHPEILPGSPKYFSRMTDE